MLHEQQLNKVLQRALDYFTFEPGSVGSDGAIEPKPSKAKAIQS
jgi:hypothetical protein